MQDERFRQIVTDFKEHILAGDIFQGVPSRRVTFPAAGGGLPIYRLLRVANPAPYMFFLRTMGMELAYAGDPAAATVEEGERPARRVLAHRSHDDGLRRKPKADREKARACDCASEVRISHGWTSPSSSPVLHVQSVSEL